MVTTRKSVMSLFVNRDCPERWVVQDADGRFWVVPSGENAWARREPFHPSEESELLPVPRHYMVMLGLPH